MDLESIITNNDYVSPLAVDATHLDQSFAATPVRVVPDQGPEIQLQAAEIGIRGQALAFRLRVSQLAQVCKGDLMVYNGTRYRIDHVERLNLAEWVAYVAA